MAYPYIYFGAQRTTPAVNFDGTNDYLTRGAGFSGEADSKLLTFSCWIKIAGGDGANRRLVCAATALNGSSLRARISITSANVLAIFGPATTDVTSTSTILAGSGWKHCLVSLDMANVANRFIYINDVSDTVNAVTYTNAVIDFTEPDWAIGGDPSGAGKWNGDIADLWFAPGVYLDLSVTANRRLFIDADGKPVDLGTNGSVPTGTAPLVFLSGDVASWHTNKGTGGGFTLNGALTASSTSPG